LKRQNLVAVDVGTASARAGIFDAAGRLLARATHPILMQRLQENHAEHDSTDIWKAVCIVVRAALAEAGVPPESIAAIGFDATCSLVIRDGRGEPVSVSVTGEDRFDTIVWLDHRAISEADRLTASGHRVLDFAGNSVSPEMQMPKLMWLKQHMPESWSRTPSIASRTTGVGGSDPGADGEVEFSCAGKSRLAGGLSRTGGACRLERAGGAPRNHRDAGRKHRPAFARSCRRAWSRYRLSGRCGHD